MEYELRKIKLQGNMTNTSEGPTVTGSGNQPDLSKLMSHFDGKGDVSVFSFIRETNFQDEYNERKLGNALIKFNSLEIANVITREPEKITNNYDYVKSVLLKRFKFTPEEFRQKLMSHKKENSATWRDLSFELRNYLEEWITGLDVSNFEYLKELILIVQIKRRLPIEMKEYFINDLIKLLL